MDVIHYVEMYTIMLNIAFDMLQNRPSNRSSRQIARKSPVHASAGPSAMNALQRAHIPGSDFVG